MEDQWKTEPVNYETDILNKRVYFITEINAKQRRVTYYCDYEDVLKVLELAEPLTTYIINRVS